MGTPPNDNSHANISLPTLGLALGVYIMSWREGGLIHNTVGRIALMAGAAGLGMFLSTFLGSLTVIFATVLIGKTDRICIKMHDLCSS